MLLLHLLRLLRYLLGLLSCLLLRLLRLLHRKLCLLRLPHLRELVLLPLLHLRYDCLLVVRALPVCALPGNVRRLLRVLRRARVLLLPLLLVLVLVLLRCCSLLKVCRVGSLVCILLRVPRCCRDHLLPVSMLCGACVPVLRLVVVLLVLGCRRVPVVCCGLRCCGLRCRCALVVVVVVVVVVVSVAVDDGLRHGVPASPLHPAATLLVRMPPATVAAAAAAVAWTLVAQVLNVFSVRKICNNERRQVIRSDIYFICFNF